MFTKYVYNAVSSIVDIKNDLIGLMTGTITDKNLLSAACSKPLTNIISTVAPGWEVDPDVPVMTNLRQYLITNKSTPTLGSYTAKPVDNGSYILWPVMGSNKILKSIDNGITWTEIALPTAPLGANNYQYGYIKNLTWIPTLNVWVLTDPTQSLNYILVGNSTGTVWTVKTTTTSQNWHTPVWNGTICVITAINSCQAIVTSTDCDTWTYSGTALPNNAYWSTPVYGNGIWVSVINNINSGTVSSIVLATSTNGTTWVSRTVTSYPWWMPQFVNGVFVSMAYYLNNIGNMMVSSDGITWTAKTCNNGASYGMHQPVHNGNIWVSSAQTSTGCGTYYSSDGLTWTTCLGISFGTIPYYAPIFCVPLNLWFILNNNYNSSYYTSVDGINWTARPTAWGSNRIIDYSIFDTSLNIFTYLSGISTIYTTIDGINWTNRPSSTNFTNLYGYSSTNFYFGKFFQTSVIQYFCYNTLTTYTYVPSLYPVFNNAVLRAKNIDNTTYKKVVIDVSALFILLTTAENFPTSTSTLNLCYSSNDTNLTQQIDLVNGGIIYIGINARYIFMLSYMFATSKFGSISGNFSAICEYSRDEDWSTILGYSTHGFFNTSNNTLYIPRLRFSLTVDYITVSAYLNLFFGNILSKKVWNAQNVLVNPSMDIRFSNINNTNMILGGVLLGGIKQTVLSSGSNSDEFVINSTTYFVALGASTYVFIIPKE